MRDAADSAGEDYQARLLAAGRAYVRFATRDAAALQETAARAFSVLVELIEEGQASGVLEPGDPEPMALLLFATTQGIAHDPGAATRSGPA